MYIFLDYTLDATCLTYPILDLNLHSATSQMTFFIYLILVYNKDFTAYKNKESNN
jgi:hypothetical protein